MVTVYAISPPFDLLDLMVCLDQEVHTDRTPTHDTMHMSIQSQLAIFRDAREGEQSSRIHCRWMASRT